MNDMRLIDSDVAQNIADKELFFDESGTVQFVLSHTPTVDAVSVVRCEYCNKGHPELGMNGCVWCVRYSRDMNTDDFCSYGELKEGAD